MVELERKEIGVEAKAEACGPHCSLPIKRLPKSLKTSSIQKAKKKDI